MSLLILNVILIKSFIVVPQIYTMCVTFKLLFFILQFIIIIMERVKMSSIVNNK